MVRKIKESSSAIMLFAVLTLTACSSNGKKIKASDSPSIEYRIVEQASGNVSSDEVWVTKDGKFQNTGIEACDIYEILDQRDYDGDGLEEAYVAQSTGGSANIPPFIVYFDKDAGVFRKVEFKNYGVFLHDSVEEWKGKWSFVGGNESHYERFIFDSGRIVKVEEYTRPKPEGSETLLSLSPQKMFGSEQEVEAGEKKNTSFDLDGDGKNEIIECEYMHGINWGDPERDYKPTMHINILWGNGRNTDLTGDEYWLEMKVLSTKTNGVNDLANGQKGVTYRWDGSTYKQQ